MSEPSVWLVAGLGNPGGRYERTRHNIGFMVVDTLRRQIGPGQSRRRFDAEIVESITSAGRLILLKPQTFMNRSGAAIAPALRWYRVPLDHFLVIYDDMDLPYGQLRLRPGGSSGGHNGLKSIEGHLGVDSYPRLRIGISRPLRGDPVSFVLNRFSPEEEASLPTVLSNAVDAVLDWQRDGIDTAMNVHNRRARQDAGES